MSAKGVAREIKNLEGDDGGVSKWLGHSVSNLVGFRTLVEIPALEPLTKSQQPTQLFTLQRPVNEYSESTLRV